MFKDFWINDSSKLLLHLKHYLPIFILLFVEYRQSLNEGVLYKFANTGLWEMVKAIYWSLLSDRNSDSSFQNRLCEYEKYFLEYALTSPPLRSITTVLCDKAGIEFLERNFPQSFKILKYQCKDNFLKYY
jgi:hypothetical protein